MGYCYCYKCKHPPPSPGPKPHTVLLFLLITAIFIALSKLLAFDSLYEAPEININWGLLAVPVVILAVVHYLSSLDKPRKFYGPVPCGRCWKPYCYCR